MSKMTGFTFEGYTLTCDRWVSGRGKCGRPAVAIAVFPHDPRHRTPVCGIHRSVEERRTYGGDRIEIPSSADAVQQRSEKEEAKRKAAEDRAVKIAEGIARQEVYDARRLREALIPWVTVRDDDVHYAGSISDHRYELIPRWYVYPEGGRKWDGATVEIDRDGPVFVVGILSASRMDLPGVLALADVLREAHRIASEPGYSFPPRAEGPERSSDE